MVADQDWKTINVGFHVGIPMRFGRPIGSRRCLYCHKLTGNDNAYSIWSSLGIFPGVYLLCPACFENVHNPASKVWLGQFSRLTMRILLLGFRNGRLICAGLKPPLDDYEWSDLAEIVHFEHHMMQVEILAADERLLPDDPPL